MEFISLIACIFAYNLAVCFGPIPTSDQNQTGKDAEHTVVVVVITLVVSEEENGCR